MASKMDAAFEQEEDLGLHAAWRQLAIRRGLLNTKFEAPRGTGVSLAYLESLVETLQQLGRDYDVPNSTADVMHQLILPALAKQSGRGRILDLVPARYTGAPQWYICHAWGAGFQEMVRTVQQDLAPDPGPTEPPLPAGFKEETMLWLDLFAVNCYPPQSAQILDDNRLRAMAAESEATVREEMDACSDGVVLVCDKDFSCLSRAWCMFEVFSAAYCYGSMGIRLALPAGLPLTKIFQLKEECKAVEFSKLGCFKAHEWRFLLSLAKHRCGLKRTNMIICEALQQALYYKLRWRAKIWETATLAAVWLQDGELTKLQLLLNPMSELRDDEETLSEMRALFKSFDQDDSGEIDEWEFVGMLTVAGWNAEDARAAFLEVNTDGQGGVSLEEFEQWWLKRVEDDHKEKQAAGDDLTVGALLNNVDCLAKHLDRMHLPEHAQFFRSSLSRLHSDFRDQDHSLHVPQPQLQGDVAHTLDQVAEHMISSDYLAACFMMYDLLVKNQEMLSQDPLTIQAPNSPVTAQEQAKLLVAYMEMLLKLVKLQLPERDCQLEFLKESIAELNAGPVKGLDANKGKKGQAGDERSFLANRMALRENLRVRFGNGQRVTARQIKELQKAVSQFVANTRQTRGMAMAHPSPTKMVLHQERASKASRPKQPLAMGDMEMPSLADLRVKLREGLGRERSQELGMLHPADKVQRRRSSLLQAGPWAAHAPAGDAVSCPLPMSNPRVPQLDLSGVTRGSKALQSSPRSLTQSPRGGAGSVASSANVTPRDKGMMSMSGTPRPCSMASPRGPSALRWASAMDDLVDRSLQRGCEDDDIISSSRPASVCGFLLASSCSTTLRTMSSELDSIRGNLPRSTRPGTSNTGRGNALSAAPVAQPDPRCSLPTLTRAMDKACGSGTEIASCPGAPSTPSTPRCPSRMLHLKLVKRRESLRGVQAFQEAAGIAGASEAGRPPSRAPARALPSSSTVNRVAVR